jgi:hypothetical protein
MLSVVFNFLKTKGHIFIVKKACGPHIHVCTYYLIFSLYFIIIENKVCYSDFEV